MTLNSIERDFPKRLSFECCSAWDLTLDRRQSRTPVHAQQCVVSTN
jgi:hypothetical protein